MITGIMMAITASDPSPGNGYKTVSAAQPMSLNFNVQGHSALLPHTPSLDVVENQGLNTTEKTAVDVNSANKIDSLTQRIIELEKKGQVTKVKWCRAPVPDPVVVRDTIREAHYYLATQVGNKEGPTGECIAIYEVHEVGKICSENTNSSSERDVGD